MDLYKRAYWDGTIVEAVAAVVAAFLGLMPQFRLTVVERVMRRELLYLCAQLVVQGVERCSHVGPSGLATRLGHHSSAEHRTLGLHRHIGAVAVPAHVALEDF